MSGLAGIIDFTGAPLDDKHLGSMLQDMSYRASDGSQRLSLGAAQFGFCSFLTTPEAPYQSQPLVNKKRDIMVMLDGRFDNRLDVLRELRLTPCFSTPMSDCTLLMHAYSKWGNNCSSYLDGDFAFAIWNDARQEFFAGRDHNGNRSLHYYWQDGRLTFATDINAIINRPWVKRKFNQNFLVQYLSIDWRSHTDTFWNGVERLPGAHSLLVTRGRKPITARYWEPTLDEKLPCTSTDDLKHYYRELIDKAVEQMTRSDHPIGFEVSGGLDSSALFCVADDLEKRDQFKAPDLLGYTLDFQGDPTADELTFVESVAKQTGRTIQRVPPTYQGIDWYRKTAMAMHDFPGYPNGIMSNGLREKAKSDGCRVIVTGVGGDEWAGLFLSGAYYREAMRSGDIATIIKCLRYDQSVLGVKPALWLIARNGLAPLAPTSIKDWFRTPRVRSAPNWLSAEFQSLHQMLPDVETNGTNHGPKIGIQLKVLWDAYNAIARESEERSAARLGVELRSPFFGKAFIQFAFSAEAWMLNRAGQDRWLHREALKEILPEQVYHRATKADFMTVFENQLQHLNDEFDFVKMANENGWVDKQALHAILSRLKQKKGNGQDGWIAWSVLCCALLQSNQTL